MRLTHLARSATDALHSHRSGDTSGSVSVSPFENAQRERGPYTSSASFSRIHLQQSWHALKCQDALKVPASLSCRPSMYVSIFIFSFLNKAFFIFRNPEHSQKPRITNSTLGDPKYGGSLRNGQHFFRFVRITSPTKAKETMTQNISKGKLDVD